jgi:uncharacterized protein
MILEGLVTTIGKEGKIHVAPMGPRVDSSMSNLLLRPYSTSQTCQNLLRHPEGVFHVTDDVTLIARGAIGLTDSPPNMPASMVKGFILNESCRAYEFKVVNADTSEDRVRLECEVVKVHRQRDFFGFNRAMFAVLEAAILASRTAFLSLEEIEKEFTKLSTLVQKTGSEKEAAAFSLLEQFVRNQANKSGPES